MGRGAGVEAVVVLKWLLGCEKMEGEEKRVQCWRVSRKGVRSLIGSSSGRVPLETYLDDLIFVVVGRS